MDEKQLKSLKKLFKDKRKSRYTYFISLFYDEIEKKNDMSLKFWMEMKAKELKMEDMKYYSLLRAYNKKKRGKTAIKSTDEKDASTNKIVELQDNEVAEILQKEKIEDKKNDRKRFRLILQSKGGVGRSFYTSLAGHKSYIEKKNIVFFDVDNANNTLTHQLKFLSEESKTKNKLIQKLDLTNKKGHIVRDLLYKKLEAVNETFHTDGYDGFFADFGSAESTQFIHLLDDLDISAFLEFTASLKFDIELNVIIVGKNSFPQSLSYLKDLLDRVKNGIKVNVLVNQYTFEDVDQYNVLVDYLSVLKEEGKWQGEIQEFGKCDTLINIIPKTLKLLEKGCSSKALSAHEKSAFEKLLVPIQI